MSEKQLRFGICGKGLLLSVGISALAAWPLLISFIAIY